MISGIHLDVLLGAGYAVFLVGVAIALEFLARHSHRRAQRYQTAGFQYLQHLDVWECPAGQQLSRIGFDEQKRIARYRAPAKACNSCSLKNNCTDSDEGRELEHHLDWWLQSELRRFHRGISLALLLLAGLIVAADIPQHATARDLGVLCVAIAPVALVGSRMLSAFRERSTGG